MPAYYVNEAAFALPERDFVDRTLHRLESPLPGADDPLGVEVRRVPIRPGETLRQLVDQEVGMSKEKVSGFTLVGDAEIAIGGAPAIVLRARLRARDVAYCQLQAHVAFEDTWIAFIVTGPHSERAACEEAFDRMVRSIEWRSG